MKCKIFVGCKLTFELNKGLNHSPEWKHDSLNHETLQTVRFDGQDYVGSFLQSSIVSVKEIEETAEDVKRKLSDYGIQHNLPSLTLFSQVFIG
ncbi:MAG: hypothetical protein WD595_01315 [Waddliaceae bacterium]